VDIQKSILFAPIQGQFLPGTALADIGHLDLLYKHPIGSLVKLCGITGQVHISGVVYVAVDIRVTVVQLSRII
jgi:hypothetical protein